MPIFLSKPVASSSTVIMDRLIDEVHNLPPEIFNQIKNLVFTPTQSVVMIDEAYKPPSSLQVSKATRRQYAWKYLSGTTTFNCADPFLLCKYISSLTKVHRYIMHSITLIADASYSRFHSTLTSFHIRNPLLQGAMQMIRAQVQTQLVDFVKQTCLIERLCVIALASAPVENTGKDGRVREFLALEKLCVMMGKKPDGAAFFGMIPLQLSWNDSEALLIPVDQFNRG